LRATLGHHEERENGAAKAEAGTEETGTWEQADYVKKQGWATMRGEWEADSKVAGECLKLLLLISERTV
jgi:hypothetical protein